MRLSNERIKELQIMLKEQLGLKYTDEEAQQAGLAIMRFVLSKERNSQPLNKENNHVNDDTGSANKTTPPN